MFFERDGNSLFPPVQAWILFHLTQAMQVFSRPWCWISVFFGWAFNLFCMIPDLFLHKDLHGGDWNKMFVLPPLKYFHLLCWLLQNLMDCFQTALANKHCCKDNWQELLGTLDYDDGVSLLRTKYSWCYGTSKTGRNMTNCFPIVLFCWT